MPLLDEKNRQTHGRKWECNDRARDSGIHFTRQGLVKDIQTQKTQVFSPTGWP